jgi:hypothetical protein
MGQLGFASPSLLAQELSGVHQQPCYLSEQLMHDLAVRHEYLHSGLTAPRSEVGSMSGA